MVTNKLQYGYLVETCLLTFGLASIDEQRLASAWNVPEAPLCWIEQGEIVIGTLTEFLPFRASKPQGKFSWEMLEQALQKKQSGALTASATMAVCQKYHIPYAVSCGIGGIGDIKGEEVCMDLPALRDLPVTLVATSPKDMLDIPATMQWLRQAGVQVLGDGSPVCNGFLFSGAETPLNGLWQNGKTQPPLLILRGIAAEKRLQDRDLLAQAVAEAKEVERQGGYYHPAANAALDRLSQGYTSQLQLESLLANIRFTAALAK